MRRVLDTNAYSAFKRLDAGVTEAVETATEILVPVVVAGELLAGFGKGSRYVTNRRDLENFLASPGVTLTHPTLTTADWYGRIWNDLRRQGTPIPTNDIWIAAQALDEGATLISRDRHFQHIPGLSWLIP